MNFSLKIWIWLSVLLLSISFLDHNNSLPIDSAAIQIHPTATAELSPETQAALAYLAERENIPPERLQVVSTHWQEYPNLNQKYWAVKALDWSGSRQFYSVLVDPNDNQIVEIANAEKAQRLAQQTKYGKLAPELYERLQTAAPDEEIEIAVWFTAPDRTSLLSQLASQHYELQSAIEESKIGLNDRSLHLAGQIRVDYDLMVQQAHLDRQMPVATMLQANGYQVVTYPNLPSLSAHIPAKTVQEVVQQDDVVAIYLLEGEFVPYIASALISNRGDIVQKRGIKGENILVGVIDTSSVEDNEYIDVSEAENPGYIVDPHATLVASVIVSTHPTLRGMVPEAKIASAPITNINQTPQKLDWFLSKNVRIINGSIGTADNTDAMQWVDRVLDYYVRHRFLTYVAAIGNFCNGNHVGSPAKAYNVISVGGTADQNNANWSNDEIWDDWTWWGGRVCKASPWQAPQLDNGSYGDREKPEVVATAKGLDMIGLGGGDMNDSGTSGAAPQVAGLAAMLVQRDSGLRIWPEGIKAIIMASAIHNIEDLIECRNLIRRLLESDGYEVIESFSAKEGLRIATDIQPDIILVDVNLPDIDINEFVDMLRSNEMTVSIPVIALSAHPFTEQAKKICDDCISRPVDIDQFLVQIAKHLKKK